MLVWMLSFGMSRAQVGIDLQFGWSHDMGTGTMDNDGFTNALSVMYTLPSAGGHLSVGLSQEGTFNVGADAVVTTTRSKMDYEMARNVLGGLKLRYNFAQSKAKWNPYLSVVLGVGNIKSTCSIAYQDVSVTPPIVSDDDIRSWKKTYFGFKPEMGIAYGVFTFGIGWIVPPSWKVDGRNIKYNPLQVNIGARFMLSSSRTE